MNSNADSVEAMMEAGAVAVAGGVTAIGSSLAVRRGKHHKNPARFIHDQNKHQQQEEE